MRISSLRRIGALAAAASLAFALAPAALAHPDPDEGHLEDDSLGHRHDPAESLEERDAQSDALSIISDGPSGKKIKNMEIAGRGKRLVENATTDVWAHGNYSYIGTFNDPCGTGENYVSGVGPVDLVDDVETPGIAIFDTSNKNKPRYVGNLPSVEGSRTNDVRVAALNSGDVLVHSNESCGGGPGGFEIYNVDDPANPVHLAHVQTDDVNAFLRDAFGFTDFGVHNLFFFTQGDKDYVSAMVESEFGNFQIFDITDPTAPELVGWWGAEELRLAELGISTNPADITDFPLILDLDAYLFSGFGTSDNRFLHDITVNEAGDRAYLSNWDAGLILLDISDPSNPTLISQAIDVANGSLDGEVNSHAAWPSEDGSIVVETEEDFDAWEGVSPPGNLTFGDDDPATPLPGTAVSTNTGDDFEGAQTGNVGTLTGDALSVASGPLASSTYPAVELAGDQPDFPAGGVTGEYVFIGRACSVSPLDPDITEDDPILNQDRVDELEAAGDTWIAVVRRGACTFRNKNFTADGLGADAIAIANNLSSTPWGGVRIWDYSDPANPVLASIFDTVCSAAPAPIEGKCDPAGTYSVHNVIVESKGNKTFAYISWYWDGMVVLDVTDPYNPVEVARFFDNSPEFLASNGGNPHDFWGVYKLPNEPTIYGSDRNGGLYTFKLTGKGKIGKN